MTSPWRYYARLENLVDGDTLDVAIDQGFSTYRESRVRLRDVDTAEVWGVSHDSEEYERGMEHSRFVEGWLTTAAVEWDGDWPLVIETEQDAAGKYGRYIAVVERRCDGAVLNTDLRSEFDDV